MLCLRNSKEIISKETYKNLSQNIHLPLWFIEKHANKMNWRMVSMFNGYLTIEFIKKYQQKIDFYSLSSNKNIDMSIINEFQSKLSPRTSIWANPHITVEFIEKNIQHVVWYLLIRNPNLTLDLYKKYADKFLRADILIFSNLPIVTYYVKNLIEIKQDELNDYSLELIGNMLSQNDNIDDVPEFLLDCDGNGFVTAGIRRQKLQPKEHKIDYLENLSKSYTKYVTDTKYITDYMVFGKTLRGYRFYKDYEKSNSYKRFVSELYGIIGIPTEIIDMILSF